MHICWIVPMYRTIGVLSLKKVCARGFRYVSSFEIRVSERTRSTCKSVAVIVPIYGSINYNTLRTIHYVVYCGMQQRFNPIECRVRWMGIL